MGFTTLGERLSIQELGDLAGRLGELAADAVEPPVRLIKTIGDAVMFVSEDVDAIVEGGIAYGTAVNRSGDWYGPTVNRASRLAATAEPDCAVVDGSARDALSDSFATKDLGTPRLKGIADAVEVCEVSRPTG